MSKADQPTPFELPADLKSLTPEQLATLAEAGRAEFGSIYEAGATAESLPRAKELADAIASIDAETTRRTEEAAATKAQFDQLMAQVNPTPTVEAPADATPPEGGAPAEAAPTAPAAPVPATVASARTAPRELGGLSGGTVINPSMAAARNMAPATVTSPPQAALEIYAASQLPGTALVAGGRIDSLAVLGELVEHTARSMPVARPRNRGAADPYGGSVVARIKHQYGDVLGPDSSVAAVEAYRRKLEAQRRPDAMATMVAAGGWCSPSEIRYSFFNIACAGGAIDLPTFGVNRGGLRWPVSPSLADAFDPNLAPFEEAMSLTTVPWVWTEASDIIAATGGAGLTVKPCIRVPCADFDEARLECYGVCVTAGNLADNAWPEATQNFLSLLDVAFQHAINAHYITTIRNLTTNVGTINCTGVGAASPVLDAVELAAVDYRKRLVMCWNDVVEVIFPEWIVPVLRADVARRTGVDMLGVTDAMVMAWFDARNVRLQLVDDYQVRGSGLPGYSSAQTAWPSTVEFMIWAPGTFAVGNGMTLDLGVVRDSTLNETNDHTAAWYEQCHLIAQFGHLARRYTVNICASGVTGSANITTCCN